MNSDYSLLWWEMSLLIDFLPLLSLHYLFIYYLYDVIVFPLFLQLSQLVT